MFKFDSRVLVATALLVSLPGLTGCKKLARKALAKEAQQSECLESCEKNVMPPAKANCASKEDPKVKDACMKAIANVCQDQCGD